MFATKRARNFKYKYCTVNISHVGAEFCLHNDVWRLLGTSTDGVAYCWDLPNSSTKVLGHELSRLIFAWASSPVDLLRRKPARKQC